MAVLNIAQFRGVLTLPGSVVVPALQLPVIAVEALTFSTSTQSAALSADCAIVRLLSDTDCHILVGANPVATTSHLKLRANIPECFTGVAGLKIAAVSA